MWGTYNKTLTRYRNHALVMAVIVINVFLLCKFFDFYYDSNDDTMMHDIMSGAYSGTPDGHNMQTLYPLGALFALFYRVCRTIPWYGLFLFLCQFGCLYLIGVRLCGLQDDIRQTGSRKVFIHKMLCLLMLSLFQWGIWLPHLVAIQYTLTCALLSATAIFLFLTTADGLDTRQFIIKNIPAILLVILAYMLRTEMLLLTFPFICLAGLYRLTGERKVFLKENLIRYGSVLGIILGGMALALAADYFAYSSAEWKDFRDFFDARTTVYDFYPELINEDEYRESVMQLGVTPSQLALFRSYNFVLDDAIDTELLVKLEDYAIGTHAPSKDWAAISRNKLTEYFYRSTHKNDAPYNYMVLWAYAAVFVAGCLMCWKYNEVWDVQTVEGASMRRFAFLWQIILLAFVRSALWMFILLRGREPDRVIHSLYLVEFSLLLAMFSSMLVKLSKRKKNICVIFGIAYVLTAFFILITVYGLRINLENVHNNQNNRAQVNRGWYAIDDYCREHKENYYFEDVASWAGFSRKIFPEADNSLANYDIMGGWICKSPLCREKLQQYDITSAYDALLDSDIVYLIISEKRVDIQGLDWLTDCYGARGDEVAVECVDTIDEQYFVYRIVGQ